MLEQVLRNINNYFIDSDGVIIEIESDGFISNDLFIVGQYVKIEGSKLNDGVYRIKEILGDKYITYEELIPEDDISYIFGLAIPRAVIKLANEIGNHVKGIKSESLGDYSVSYDDWQTKFRNELSVWRKVYR